MSAPAPPPARNLLRGKNVVVTAAAGTGIGFWVAQRAAEEGARVLLSDTHEKRLREATARIAKISAHAPASALCDVTEQTQVDALFAHALAELGHVDVLVNNAGLGGFAKLADMTDAQWTRVLDTTLTGTMRVTRAFLPHFCERRAGAIVNNASVLGWRAQPGQSHYAAAKAGVMAFTRCVAMEAAPFGVRVNAVAPSLAMHEFLSKVTPDGLLEKLVQQEAFGRAAAPFEVANAILFLASDLASYMTGEVLSVSSQRA